MDREDKDAVKNARDMLLALRARVSSGGGACVSPKHATSAALTMGILHTASRTRRLEPHTRAAAQLSAFHQIWSEKKKVRQGKRRKKCKKKKQWR